MPARKQKHDIRVRMYRVGFGDCFLISFGGAKKRHVLVDFGVHQKGDIDTMDRVMDEIERHTNKELALVVATHAHRDHIHGFGKFAERFADFKIDEVWLPWSEDPDDKFAGSLKKKHLALFEALHLHFEATNAAANPRYAAAVAALENLRGNGKALTALRTGFGATKKVRYLKGGGKSREIDGIPGLSVDVLGPPKSEEFLGRMDPPAGQHFLTKPGAVSGALEPFELSWVAPPGASGPRLSPAEERALQSLAEAPADSLALTLDNVVNNTSLVLLFRYRGKTLLFPGDAQWGNWESWITKDGAGEILSEVNFFKVAHHGSHNATPKDVVSSLPKGQFAVMVPTEKKPFDTIPRLPLMKALGDQCGRALVRSDSIEVPGTHKGPKVAKPPKGFTKGELWFDYAISV